MRVYIRNEGGMHVAVGNGYGHVLRTACRTISQHQEVINKSFDRVE
jgi:hypothetical protein